MAITPRGGSHFYFGYTPELHTCSGALPETDIRNDGGFAIAPPSNNGRGVYAWQEGRSILTDAKPAPMPAYIYNVFINAFNKSIRDDVGNANKRQQTPTNANNLYTKGNRDDSLFHAAYSLLKGGADENFVINTICLLGKSCSPPFPEKEIFAKIESAIQRAKNQERNLTQDIKEWILTTNGNFLTTDAYVSQHLTTRDEKKKAQVILSRFAKEGFIERTGPKAGCYRLVDKECEDIDFINANIETVDLWLPFGINKLLEVTYGDIILVAGEPNSGKTGLLLNIIKANMHKFKTYLFSSELAGPRLKKRLLKFDDIAIGDWKFKAKNRSKDFADVIRSGEGKLNVIDFLEIHDEFYKVGGLLSDIFHKLDGAIAIVALQKNRGTDTGLGGLRNLEKPSIALSLSPNTIKIVKGKNWADELKNPNGLMRKFKLAAGCKFFPEGGWYEE
jgi:hypothetical protein